MRLSSWSADWQREFALVTLRGANSPAEMPCNFFPTANDFKWHSVLPEKSKIHHHYSDWSLAGTGNSVCQGKPLEIGMKRFFGSEAMTNEKS